MLETSKDLLYVVISFCVLWLTVFMCWVLYYIAMFLKQGYDITRGFKAKLEKADKVLDAVREKIEKSSSHLALVAEGIKQLVVYLVEKKTGKEEKKRKK